MNSPALPSVIHPAVPETDIGGADGAWASTFRPILMLDDREPAPPLAFGYTVFRDAGQSKSSKFTITPPTDGTVIEYALWFDWDIEHLYDLEHVWVHLGANKSVSRVEGSMHGYRVSMDTGNGIPNLRGDRPVLFVEPGKHAIWAAAQPMSFMAGAMIRQKCGPDAGLHEIHLGNRFAESGAYSATADDQRLAKRAMQRAAFTPSFDFSRSSDDCPVSLVPWPVLERWIPERVSALIAALRSNDCTDDPDRSNSDARQVGHG